VRDAWGEFRRRGIEVFGISADPVKSHKKFADKFALPFTLLADEAKTVIQAYGAWGRKSFMGREFDGILRQSFLVDPKGAIAKVYAKVKPEGHAAEVLADVAALSGGGASSAPVLKPVEKAKPAARGKPSASSARKAKPKS